MSMLIAALAGMAQAAPAAKPADPMMSADAAWYKAMKAAKDEHFDACFIRKVTANCELFVNGIENARKLGKGHSGVEHALLPNLYEVRMRTVYLQLADGKTDAAITTGRIGLETAMAHFEGGKHFHAATESLALRVAFAKALVTAKRNKDAEEQYAVSNQIAKGVYSSAKDASAAPAFESPVYRVWRDALRYGADANLDWMELITSQAGPKETPAVIASVADKLGNALAYLELAERRKILWVDTRAIRSDLIAALAKERVNLLVDLGRFRDARLQLGSADATIALSANGNDYYAQRAKGWRSDLKATNAFICKKGASKVPMETGMIPC